MPVRKKKSDMSLDEQLRTYGIKKVDYELYKEKLLGLGYSQEQVTRVIIRKSSNNTVQKLIDQHKTFIDKGFNHEQIIQMASHGGGSKNLQAVIEKYEALVSLNFNNEQIVKMVSRDGGSIKLQLALEKHAAFVRDGKNNEQIVQMVLREHSQKKLANTVKSVPATTARREKKLIMSLDEQLNGANIKKIDCEQYKEKLLRLGYAEALIDKLILTKCSNNAVDALINLHQVLIDKGFSHEHLVKIVSYKGGSNNLQALVENYEAIVNLKFTNKQIIQMVAHTGGSKNLQAVLEKYQDLARLGYKNEQIVKMVAHSGGKNNLQAVVENFEVLVSLKFTNHQILQVVSHGGGSNNMQAVVENYKELEKLGYTNEQIVKMVARNGSKKMLALLENKVTASAHRKEKFEMTLDEQLAIFKIEKAHYENFKEKMVGLGYSQVQIDNVILRDSSKKAVDALINLHQALIDKGFSHEQIVDITSHHGGSKNLQALVDKYESLVNLGYTNHQIVYMVARHGGSKNLESALAFGKRETTVNNGGLRSAIFTSDIAGTLLSRLRLLAKRKTYDWAFFNGDKVTLTLKETYTDIQALSFGYALKIMHQLSSEFRRLFEKSNLTSPFELQLTAEGVDELNAPEILISKLVACVEKLVQFYPLTLASRGELWELSARACELKLNSLYVHPFYVYRTRMWLSKTYQNSMMNLYFQRPSLSKEGILSLKIKSASLPGLNNELAQVLFLTIINIESKWRNKAASYLEFCRNLESEQFGEDKAKIILNKLALEYSDLNKGLPQTLFEHCLKQKFLQLLHLDKTQHFIENEHGAFNLSFVDDDLLVSSFCEFMSYIRSGLEYTNPNSSDVDENLAKIGQELDNFMEDNMLQEAQVKAIDNAMQSVEQMIKELDTYLHACETQQAVSNDEVSIDVLRSPDANLLVFSDVYDATNVMEPLMDDEVELCRSIPGLTSN